jgi:hypothetical protein
MTTQKVEAKKQGRTQYSAEFKQQALLPSRKARTWSNDFRDCVFRVHDHPPRMTPARTAQAHVWLESRLHFQAHVSLEEVPSGGAGARRSE